MVKVPGNKTKMHVGFTYSKHPQYFNVLNMFSISQSSSSSSGIETVDTGFICISLALFSLLCFIY